MKSDQRLGGYHTLHLLNSHEDPTFVRSVLFYHIAREYIPAPEANFMRVVINGESWGIYVNQQPCNKEFLKDCFGSSKGARWKVPGSPNGRGGLGYLGEEIAPYKKLYELKSKEDTNSWKALIRLCRLLNQTPPEQLEAALAPLLDIDATLKYLALDNVFVNNDGYWARASDYSIFLDEKGKFHLIPHDDNETFSLPQGGPGPGMGRGPRGQDGGLGAVRPPRGGRGADLDPFAGADDSNKALLQKLLAVPALRAKYISYVRSISDKWLDWNRIGPLVEQYHGLIAADVKTDTHKIDSWEEFTNGVAGESDSGENRGFGFGPGRAKISLKKFVEQRRAYLTSAPALKVAAKE